MIKKNLGILVAALFLTIGIGIISVAADEVRLACSPNVEIDLAGYGIYYRVAGVSNFTRFGYFDMGSDVTNPSFLITGLVKGQTYEFAATAYDAAGNESGFSAPISYTIPEPFPLDSTTFAADTSGETVIDTVKDTIDAVVATIPASPAARFWQRTLGPATSYDQVTVEFTGFATVPVPVSVIIRDSASNARLSREYVVWIGPEYPSRRIVIPLLGASANAKAVCYFGRAAATFQFNSVKVVRETQSLLATDTFYLAEQLGPTNGGLYSVVLVMEPAPGASAQEITAYYNAGDATADENIAAVYRFAATAVSARIDIRTPDLPGILFVHQNVFGTAPNETKSAGVILPYLPGNLVGHEEDSDLLYDEMIVDGSDITIANSYRTKPVTITAGSTAPADAPRRANMKSLFTRADLADYMFINGRLGSNLEN